MRILSEIVDFIISLVTSTSRTLRHKTSPGGGRQFVYEIPGQSTRPSPVDMLGPRYFYSAPGVSVLMGDYTQVWNYWHQGLVPADSVTTPDQIKDWILANTSHGFAWNLSDYAGEYMHPESLWWRTPCNTHDGRRLLAFESADDFALYVLTWAA